MGAKQHWIIDPHLKTWAWLCIIHIDGCYCLHICRVKRNRRGKTRKKSSLGLYLLFSNFEADAFLFVPSAIIVHDLMSKSCSWEQKGWLYQTSAICYCLRNMSEKYVQMSPAGNNKGKSVKSTQCMLLKQLQQMLYNVIHFSIVLTSCFEEN